MQRYTWIYSLASPLAKDQCTQLAQAFEAFLNQWQSHGTPVAGQIYLAHDHFVIIQANPNEDRPSGCSIDSLKKTVEQILQQHGLNWVDASHIFYQRTNGTIGSVHFQELSAQIEQGTLTADTVVFDHSLGQSDDLSQWEVPLKATWMKRFLPKGAVSNS